MTKMDLYQILITHNRPWTVQGNYFFYDFVLDIDWDIAKTVKG